jgi:hypothetical protein
MDAISRIPRAVPWWHPLSYALSTALSALAPGIAHPADPGPAPSKPASTLEKTGDAIGLFRGSIDIDELDASGDTLRNPVISEPEPEDEDPDGATNPLVFWSGCWISAGFVG